MGGRAARNEVLSDCDKTEGEGKKDCLEKERERDEREREEWRRRRSGGVK